MKRIRRTRRNILIGAAVSMPLWISFFLLKRFGESLAFIGEYVSERIIGNAIVALYETDAEMRARHMTWLKAHAGQWLRLGKAWICGCGGVWGPGASDCDTCRVARPLWTDTRVAEGGPS